MGALLSYRKSGQGTSECLPQNLFPYGYLNFQAPIKNTGFLSSILVFYLICIFLDYWLWGNCLKVLSLIFILSIVGVSVTLVSRDCCED